MARTFDGPLTAEDVAYLRTVRSEAVVQNLIALHGTGDTPTESVDDILGDVDAPPFDPGEYTVSEVRRYLETAGEQEHARVVAAERDGRRRSGILDH